MNGCGRLVAEQRRDALGLTVYEALSERARSRAGHLEVLEALPRRTRIHDDRVPKRPAVGIRLLALVPDLAHGHELLQAGGRGHEVTVETARENDVQ